MIVKDTAHKKYLCLLINIAQMQVAAVMICPNFSHSSISLEIQNIALMAIMINNIFRTVFIVVLIKFVWYLLRLACCLCSHKWLYSFRKGSSSIHPKL